MACINACPSGAIGDSGINPEKCLSAISQKKIKTEEETVLLKKNKTVWGCDLCQNICPMNGNKKLSEFEFFHTNRLNNITEELIQNMPEDVFRTYPFSWRGKQTILENLRLIR